MGLLDFVGKLIGLGGTPSQKIELSQSATAAGLPIIYGRRRVEAVTVLKRVSNRRAAATGNGQSIVVERGFDDRDDPLKHNNWLHRVDVWGQGPIEAIERFWIDGDAHTHKRFGSKRPYFRAVSLLGSETQGALTGLSLVEAGWGTSHQGKGVAYSWTRFFNSTSHPQYRAEPDLRADIRGLKLYDPRQDSTYGGSGSQRFADASTWQYGNNRALVVLNYMMGSFGFGAPASELDIDSFKIAADVCDQTVTIPAVPTNQTGAAIPDWLDPITGLRGTINVGDYFPNNRPFQVGTTQRRYEADIVIDPKKGVVENVKSLLKEFGWSLSWSNGRHRLVIEDAVSGPVMTFGEDDILGGWSVQRGSRSERLNRMTIEFPNANKNFEKDTVSWPERGTAEHIAFLAEDGGRDLHTNDSLPSVTDYYRARAYAEFRVRKSRVGERILGLQLAPRALLLEPGDVIGIDFASKGYVSPDNLFIVERVSVSSLLDVSVDLIRYDPAVYGAELPDPEPVAPNDTNPDAWQDPDAISNLVASEYHTQKADGSVISGILATWDPPTSNIPIDRIEVKWRDNADVDFTGDDYQGTLLLDHTATACRIPDLVDNRFYRVVVSYVTRLRQRSIDAVLEAVDLTATTISKLDTIEDGATRTEFRGAHNPGILYERGDVVTSAGSSYVFISTIPAAGTAVTDPVYWELLASVGADGAAGSDGGFFDIMFRRAATQPATPTGDSPAGWSDGPPVADGNPLWMIKGLKSAGDTLIGSWSTPQEIGGLGLEVEYSVAGTDPWHTGFQVGDLYMRQRLTGGSWSAAQRIIGEKGDPGADGSDGSPGNPGPPGSDGSDGADGDNGFSISASPSVIAVLTTSNGVPKAGQLPATSQIQLLQGSLDRTSPASYSRVAVNCNASVSSSGLVTINSIAADSGYVEVTASYAGASIKTRITFVKARQGDAATSIEVSANVVDNTTYGVAAGPVSLSLGVGGTVALDGYLTYTSSPTGHYQTLKVQYSTNGSTWNDIGSAQIGEAYNQFFAFADITRSRAGPVSSPATWQFRMLAKKSGGTVTEFGSSSNFRVQWT